ncbi:penicillin acylase family protein [Pseudidiomarina insulisalsae]|uniref:Peptidase S45 n=1 Tax=Pseudidiomarina insulisalsae TaxID=575789 RepID=A0A432YAB0_9GAMM|nr:penicillin acylase family protein [Pseudidiomarina insulisalsae]RUO57919.1 peptidase S45 [Pseudidiomarina insulisalsae]
MHKTLLPLLAVTLIGCSPTGKQVQTPGYQAEIRYTAHGVPHIKANDYGSLGFGEGYAAARDQICNLSYVVTQVRGELAQHLGAGPQQRFAISDAAVKSLRLYERAEQAFTTLRPQLRDMLSGYAAGVNHYLATTNKPGSWCQGQSWVSQVSATDIFARGYLITTNLPLLAGAMYQATPPQQEITGRDAGAALLAQAESAFALDHLGSNAWAIGNDLTAHEGGLLMGNPHYPWFGSNRFWEKHLTIPDEYDVYGVSLAGIPGVAIGFNKHLGWSHTVSASRRLAVYQLQLAANDPLSYMVDGQSRKLEERQVSVKVKGPDGATSEQQHSLWFSEYGPLVKFGGFDWTETTAFAINDVNYDNFVILEQWLDMARADNMAQFIAAHERWNALPWVNTIATGSEGKAVYIDGSSVGNLSEEAIEKWQQMYSESPTIQQLYDQRQLMLFNGSRSDFRWQPTSGQPLAESVPFAQRPRLIRDDYVFNANDSYWVAHKDARDIQRSPLYGPVDSAISWRSRMNLHYLTEPAYRGTDARFDLKEVQQALFTNGSMAYRIFYTELTDVCAQQLPLSKACAALSQFTGNYDISSRGAVLFREWIFAYQHLVNAEQAQLYRVPFSADDPYATPRGLGNAEQAMAALQLAADLLEQQEISLDARLGEQQKAPRNEQLIPLHGGHHYDGVINMMDQRGSDTIGPFPESNRLKPWSTLTDRGYPITGGGSFIFTVAFTPEGPHAEALLTYGQSEDPDSPFYAEQTQLLADKQWRQVIFMQREVEANTVETQQVQGNREPHVALQN